MGDRIVKHDDDLAGLPGKSGGHLDHDHGAEAPQPRLRGQRVGATRLLIGDAAEVLRRLPANRFHACITSPPYYSARDYRMEGQIGLEETPAAYIARLIEVFREVRRVLRADGTLWLNIADSYAYGGGGRDANLANRFRYKKSAGGLDRLPEHRPVKRPPSGVKKKDLLGIGWQLAVALRDDGWWLRQEVVWEKPKTMPNNADDRFAQSHERVFLLAKSARYRFDASMRDQHSVWAIPVRPTLGPHTAPFPEELVRRCMIAGTAEGHEVLDPFAGSGTTGVVAMQMRRKATLIDLNPDFVEFARRRLNGEDDAAPKSHRAASVTTEAATGGKSQTHRARLRSKGFRPFQIWVPDVRSTEGEAEAGRQARLLGDTPSVSMIEPARRGDVYTLDGTMEMVLVVQANAYTTAHILVCPLTLEGADAPLLRVGVGASAGLPLQGPAWAALDRLAAVPRAALSARIGHITDAEMVEVGRMLLPLLGIA